MNIEKIQSSTFFKLLASERDTPDGAQVEIACYMYLYHTTSLLIDLIGQ